MRAKKSQAAKKKSQTLRTNCGSDASKAVNCDVDQETSNGPTRLNARKARSLHMLEAHQNVRLVSGNSITVGTSNRIEVNRKPQSLSILHEDGKCGSAKPAFKMPSDFGLNPNPEDTPEGAASGPMVSLPKKRNKRAKASNNHAAVGSLKRRRTGSTNTLSMEERIPSIAEEIAVRVSVCVHGMAEVDENLAIDGTTDDAESSSTKIPAEMTPSVSDEHAFEKISGSYRREPSPDIANVYETTGMQTRRKRMRQTRSHGEPFSSTETSLLQNYSEVSEVTDGTEEALETTVVHSLGASDLDPTTKENFPDTVLTLNMTPGKKTRKRVAKRKYQKSPSLSKSAHATDGTDQVAISRKPRKSATSSALASNLGSYWTQPVSDRRSTRSGNRISADVETEVDAQNHGLFEGSYGNGSEKGECHTQGDTEISSVSDRGVSKLTHDSVLGTSASGEKEECSNEDQGDYASDRGMGCFPVSDEHRKILNQDNVHEGTSLDTISASGEDCESHNECEKNICTLFKKSHHLDQSFSETEKVGDSSKPDYSCINTSNAVRTVFDDGNDCVDEKNARSDSVVTHAVQRPFGSDDEGKLGNSQLASASGGLAGDVPKSIASAFIPECGFTFANESNRELEENPAMMASSSHSEISVSSHSFDVEESGHCVSEHKIPALHDKETQDSANIDKGSSLFARTHSVLSNISKIGKEGIVDEALNGIGSMLNNLVLEDDAAIENTAFIPYLRVEETSSRRSDSIVNFASKSGTSPDQPGSTVITSDGNRGSTLAVCELSKAVGYSIGGVAISREGAVENFETNVQQVCSDRQHVLPALISGENAIDAPESGTEAEEHASSPKPHNTLEDTVEATKVKSVTPPAESSVVSQTTGDSNDVIPTQDDKIYAEVQVDDPGLGSKKLPSQSGPVGKCSSPHQQHEELVDSEGHFNRSFYNYDVSMYGYEEHDWRDFDEGLLEDPQDRDNSEGCPEGGSPSKLRQESESSGPLEAAKSLLSLSAKSSHVAEGHPEVIIFFPSNGDHYYLESNNAIAPCVPGFVNSQEAGTRLEVTSMNDSPKSAPLNDEEVKGIGAVVSGPSLSTSSNHITEISNRPILDGILGNTLKEPMGPEQHKTEDSRCPVDSQLTSNLIDGADSSPLRPSSKGNLSAQQINNAEQMQCDKCGIPMVTNTSVTDRLQCKLVDAAVQTDPWMNLTIHSTSSNDNGMSSGVVATHDTNSGEGTTDHEDDQPPAPLDDEQCELLRKRFKEWKDKLARGEPTTVDPSDEVFLDYFRDQFDYQLKKFKRSFNL